MQHSIIRDPCPKERFLFMLIRGSLENRSLYVADRLLIIMSRVLETQRLYRHWN